MSDQIRRQVYMAAQAQCRKDGIAETNENYLLYLLRFKEHLESEPQNEARDAYLTVTITEIESLQRMVNKIMQGPEDRKDWNKEEGRAELTVITICRCCKGTIVLYHCANTGCPWCALCGDANNAKTQIPAS